MEIVFEWFRESMNCYGIYKGWGEAVRFVKERVSVKGKGWRMPGKESKLMLFEPLGREWG